jgi:hypothetical protein
MSDPDNDILAFTLITILTYRSLYKNGYLIFRDYLCHGKLKALKSEENHAKGKTIRKDSQ